MLIQQLKKRKLTLIMLSDDCLHTVILFLPASSILQCSRINIQWNRVIRSLKMTDWQHLYYERVGRIFDVSTYFNWKRALVIAEQHDSVIEAICSWNKEVVQIMSPWKGTDDFTQLHDAILIGSNLHNGVIRDVTPTISTQGICLHFVYDDAFVVRGIRQTCLKRGDVPCDNCAKRKQCSKQEYKYFLRKLDHPKANDHLCLRMRRGGVA